jgi:hypothetical protein
MPGPRQAFQTLQTNGARFVGIVILRARRLSSSRLAQEIVRAAALYPGVADEANHAAAAAASGPHGGRIMVALGLAPGGSDASAAEFSSALRTRWRPA